jgi:putative ABC transport system permease protein
MIFTLALRNLVHDRVRLLITLTGVVFAVVLIAVQAGLFFGFMATTSGVIEHSGADVWVSSKGLQNFDVAIPMPDRKRYQVLSVDGVAKAERFVIQFANWRKPGGGEEAIEIVGFDLASGLGGPWNVVAGGVDRLQLPDTVIIEELYKAKLGITELGQEVEINGRRARVVGFTQGIRSFTTSPYVFTSYKNGLNYARYEEDQTNYLLIQAGDGVSPKVLKERIRGAVSDVDVYTTPEFGRKTQRYWIMTTGAGMALWLAAALGLVVGMVVVAQTLYATTMDHLPEFGTLRAMGAPNSYIYGIIFNQAVMSAVTGYVCGMGISLVIVWLSRGSGVAILLPWPMAVGLFVLTLSMCLAAAYVSIHKVTRIDPAMVFKGR